MIISLKSAKLSTSFIECEKNGFESINFFFGGKKNHQRYYHHYRNYWTCTKWCLVQQSLTGLFIYLPLRVSLCLWLENINMSKSVKWNMIVKHEMTEHLEMSTQSDLYTRIKTLIVVHFVYAHHSERNAFTNRVERCLSSVSVCCICCSAYTRDSFHRLNVTIVSYFDQIACEAKPRYQLPEWIQTSRRFNSQMPMKCLSRTNSDNNNNAKKKLLRNHYLHLGLCIAQIWLKTASV